MERVNTVKRDQYCFLYILFQIQHVLIWSTAVG